MLLSIYTATRVQRCQYWLSSHLVPSAVTSDACAEDLAARTKLVVKQIIRKLPRDLDRRLPGERALEFPGEHRVITQKNDLGLQLHWKCGHAPISVIRRLIEHNAIEGFEGLKASDVGELVEGCTVCHCGKFKKLPSEGSIHIDTVNGSTWSLDNFGPLPHPDRAGNRYSLTATEQ